MKNCFTSAIIFLVFVTLSACNSGGGSSAPEAPITYLPPGTYTGFGQDFFGGPECTNFQGTVEFNIQSDGSSNTSWIITANDPKPIPFSADTILTKDPCMEHQLSNESDSNIKVSLSSCVFSNSTKTLTGRFKIFGFDGESGESEDRIDCSMKLNAVSL